jgi:hypothetical protein
MTSKQGALFVLALIVLSLNSYAKVIIYPTNGIHINASPGIPGETNVRFKPDANLTTPVKYRLSSFHLNGRDIDKSKLKVSNLYTEGDKSLGRFQLVLSGKESSNPITSTFKFNSQWGDAPGIYLGSLSSDKNTTDIPVKVVVSPKTTISLNPSSFKIVTSNFDTPKVQQVDLIFGTNRPNWELYVMGENLTKFGGEFIPKTKLYVKLKDNPEFKWTDVSKPVKIYSGGSISPSKIATLEFLVKTDKLKEAGEYLGKIKFLISYI